MYGPISTTFGFCPLKKVFVSWKKKKKLLFDLSPPCTSSGFVILKTRNDHHIGGAFGKVQSAHIGKAVELKESMTIAEFMYSCI